MSGVAKLLKGNAAYFFIAVGIAWAAVGVLTGSVLVAWPTAACIAAGILLRLLPGHRLTWAWGLATASMGLIISAYQIYAWAPFIGGAFSTLAGATLAGFAVFAVVHLFLFYAGTAGTQSVKSETS